VEQDEAGRAMMSVEVTFRLTRPLRPRMMTAMVMAALPQDARQVLLAQGTQIKVVFKTEGNVEQPIDSGPDFGLEIVSIEAEPMDGPRH
jgi:hypothetical protein